MDVRGAAAEGAARQLAASRFDAAHRALLADPAIQFRLARPTPEVRPTWLRELGEWLSWILWPIGRMLLWIGRLFPGASVLLWSVIGVAAALVAWTTIERIRHGAWRWPWLRRRPASAPSPPPVEPALFEEEPARAWLAEADALAAGGHFAAAAHLLLFRSVEDLARRRPGLVGPASTARELAAAPALPPGARDRFAVIAALVERSLFGGRPVGAAEWTGARACYAELALPGSWRP